METFTSSNQFPASGPFTDSEWFRASNAFTPSDYFSGSEPFTPSKSFSVSDSFVVVLPVGGGANASDQKTNSIAPALGASLGVLAVVGVLGFMLFLWKRRSGVEEIIEPICNNAGDCLLAAVLKTTFRHATKIYLTVIMEI
jgi:hypothetical protein